VRSDRIRAEDIWVEKVRDKSNITVHMNTKPLEIVGSMMGVTGLRVATPSPLGEGQGELVLPLDGVFVAIGSSPITSLVDNLGAEKDAE
jgi:thioredoxin reductase